MAYGVEYTPELNKAIEEELLRNIEEERMRQMAAAQGAAMRRGLTGGSYEGTLSAGVNRGAMDARTSALTSLAIENAKRQRDERLLAEERTFRSGEAGKDRQLSRDLQAGELGDKDKTRAFQARQAQLERNYGLITGGMNIAAEDRARQFEDRQNYLNRDAQWTLNEANINRDIQLKGGGGSAWAQLAGRGVGALIGGSVGGPVGGYVGGEMGADAASAVSGAPAYSSLGGAPAYSSLGGAPAQASFSGAPADPSRAGKDSLGDASKAWSNYSFGDTSDVGELMYGYLPSVNMLYDNVLASSIAYDPYTQDIRPGNPDVPMSGTSLHTESEQRRIDSFTKKRQDTIEKLKMLRGGV